MPQNRLAQINSVLRVIIPTSTFVLFIIVLLIAIYSSRLSPNLYWLGIMVLLMVYVAIWILGFKKLSVNISGIGAIEIDKTKLQNLVAVTKKKTGNRRPPTLQAFALSRNEVNQKAANVSESQQKIRDEIAYVATQNNLSLEKDPVDLAKELQKKQALDPWVNEAIEFILENADDIIRNGDQTELDDLEFIANGVLEELAKAENNSKK